MQEIKRRVGFNADHYFRWRKYYPYCAGLLGDLFPHKLHPYMLGAVIVDNPATKDTNTENGFGGASFDLGDKNGKLTLLGTPGGTITFNDTDD